MPRQEQLSFALMIAEAAFRFAEKGNNLDATLAHIQGLVSPMRTAREDVAEAVRKFHVERGCCDGTFAEPCTFRLEQQAAKRGPKAEQPWSEYEGTE